MHGVFVVQNLTPFDAEINEPIRNYIAAQLIFHFNVLFPKLRLVTILEHDVVSFLVFVDNHASVLNNLFTDTFKEHLSSCFERVCKHRKCQILEQIFLHGIFYGSCSVACCLALNHSQCGCICFCFEVVFSYSLLSADAHFQPVNRDDMEFVYHECVLLISCSLPDSCIHLVEFLMQLERLLVTNHMSSHKWNQLV